MNEQPQIQQQNDQQESPLCLKCCQPIDPLAHYCPNCGEASGKYTTYMPFVNIQWQCTVWGRMWRQIWQPGISVSGKILRFFMVVWNVPFILIGLFFKPQKQAEEENVELTDTEE